MDSAPRAGSEEAAARSGAAASGTSRAGKDGRLHAVERTASVVCGVRIEITREDAGTPAFTIGDAVEAYVAHVVASGRSVRSDLVLFRLHCQNLVHFHPLDTFRPAQAEAVKGALFRSGLSAQSVVHVLSFLRRACNYAVAQGKAEKNPFRVVQGGVFSMPRPNNERTRWLTPDEARALLAELRRRSEAVFLMALLALRTGMRAAEVFRLRRDDIDAAAGVIHVRGKMTGGDEVVHAPRDVIALLLGLPGDPHGLVFHDGKGHQLYQTPGIFMRAVRDLGLQADASSRQRVTFHTLRHTFASWLAQSGKVTLQELEALMRHHSLQMTLRYAHLIPSATAGKIDIIGSVLAEQKKP